MRTVTEALGNGTRRNGTSGSGTHGTSMLVGALLLAVTGCGSPMGVIPSRKLSLTVENYVVQQGVGDAATESPSVLICVKAASDVSAHDLATVRSMSVEWPGGSPWTPIASGSSRLTSGELSICSWQPAVLVLADWGVGYRLVASADLPQVELAVGTYTLHVTFADGQEVTRSVTYDGQAMGAPAAVTLYPTTLGVGIAWDAPPVSLDWGLEVNSGDGRTMLGSADYYFAYGNTTSGWVKTDLARGTPYLLGLFMLGPFNSRYVTIPFTVP